MKGPCLDLEYSIPHHLKANDSPYLYKSVGLTRSTERVLMVSKDGMVILHFNIYYYYIIIKGAQMKGPQSSIVVCVTTMTKWPQH